MIQHPSRRPVAVVAAAALLALPLAACKEKQPPPRYISTDADPQTPAPAADEPVSGLESLLGDRPEASPAVPAVREGYTESTAAGLIWTAPAHWERRQPTNPMRSAEFTARHTDAASPGVEIIVSYFGPQGAGGVEENLERWARQIVDANNRPVVPEVRPFFAGNLAITFTAASGTFLAGMPGQTPTPTPDWTMLAAIVEGGPIGPVYVRMIGPVSDVALLRADFLELLQTLKPAPVTPLGETQAPATTGDAPAPGATPPAPAPAPY